MLSSLRLAAAAALVALSSVQALPQSTSNPSTDNTTTTACNNSPELCSRQYNRVSHMGAHNIAFLRDDSTNDSVSGNQYKNATIALDAGLRLLQAQVHNEAGVLRLCHSSCSLLDAGTLQAWLEPINYWMSQNPNDVVTILLVNSDDRPAAEFGAAFQGSGIAQYGYAPSAAGPTGDWPTLQSMIDQGTRLVTFVTNMQASTDHAYLLPEFDYVFETPFEVTTIDGFNCTLDRPSSAGAAATAVSNNYLSLVNHFKYQTVIASVMVPDVDTLSVVNNPSSDAVGNLGRHLSTCQSEWSQVPNFVLVDFWSEGDPIAAVDEVNGVSDITGRATSDSTADGDSGANVNMRNLEHGALLAFLTGALLLF